MVAAETGSVALDDLDLQCARSCMCCFALQLKFWLSFYVAHLMLVFAQAQQC
jgi:hypothetical protein